MSLTIIDIVEVEAAQGALEIVHAKTFVPNPSPVIEVVGDKELVIVPDPEIKVHAPVPAVGVFAERIVVGLLIHKVWFEPAFEIEGGAIPVIVTLETELAQGGFEIVQLKIFTPTPRPVIVVEADKEFVIVPEPEINVHTPVPTKGLLAAIVAPPETQTV